MIWKVINRASLSTLVGQITTIPTVLLLMHFASATFLPAWIILTGLGFIYALLFSWFVEVLLEKIK